MDIVTAKLISFTEKILTYRDRSRYIKKEKAKNLHPFFEWLHAFLWAAGVVLLLNQYLFQAYVIPSPSMTPALKIQDRLLVNKLIYGPELIPSLFKLPGLTTPKRQDIILFENPEYHSRGAFFDISQRLIFMLSLSLIDIDKDENGKPAHHFLIKRVVGEGGESILFNKGDVSIKPYNTVDYIPENDFLKFQGLNSHSFRSIEPITYNKVDEYIRGRVSSESNIILKDSPTLPNDFYSDRYNSDLLNRKYLSQLSPSKVSNYMAFNKSRLGIYIPEGWILPMGDNRDNSRDGRYFGPIKESEVLGKVTLRFWPFNNLGKVE